MPTACHPHAHVSTSCANGRCVLQLLPSARRSRQKGVDPAVSVGPAKEARTDCRCTRLGGRRRAPRVCGGSHPARDRPSPCCSSPFHHDVRVDLGMRRISSGGSLFAFPAGARMAFAERGGLIVSPGLRSVHSRVAGLACVPPPLVGSTSTTPNWLVWASYTSYLQRASDEEYVMKLACTSERRSTTGSTYHILGPR